MTRPSRPSKGGEQRAKVLDKLRKAGVPEELLSMGRAELETLISGIAIGGRDIAFVSQAVQKVPTGKVEKMVTWWTSALVSGPITQWVNFSSNQALVAMRQLIERPLEALIEIPIATLSGRERKVLLGQVGAEIFGFFNSIPIGIKAMREAFWKSGIPGIAAKAEITPGVIDVAAGFPSRLLASGDALAKVQAVGASFSGSAYRQALREGLRPYSNEFRERVAYYVSHPTDAMKSEADKVASEVTFVSPLGPITQTISSIRNKYPWIKFALPFIKAPYNIAVHGVERVPLVGLAKTAATKELLKGGRTSEIVARQAVGGLTAVAVGTLVRDGRITGGLPRDPSYRATQMAAGRPPYSILVGDKWYSYDRYEPLATVLGSLADMWQMGEQEGWHRIDDVAWGRAAGRMADSIGTLVSAKTYFKGIGDVLEVIINPTKEGEIWLQLYLGSFIPAAVAQTASVDPVARDLTSKVEGAMGTMQELQNTFLYRIPYLSKKRNNRS